MPPGPGRHWGRRLETCGQHPDCGASASALHTPTSRSGAAPSKTLGFGLALADELPVPLPDQREEQRRYRAASEADRQRCRDQHAELGPRPPRRPRSRPRCRPDVGGHRTRRPRLQRRLRPRSGDPRHVLGNHLRARHPRTVLAAGDAACRPMPWRAGSREDSRDLSTRSQRLFVASPPAGNRDIR